MTSTTIHTPHGREIYSAPQLEVIETVVEHGFATSEEGATVPGFGDPIEAAWINYGYEIQSLEQY